MNRTWNLLCLPALLAVACAVSPARAADSDKPSLENKIDLLLQQVGEMQKKMDRQQVEAEHKDEQLELRLRVLKNRVTELEQQFDRLDKGRVSNYPPTSPTVTPDLERDLKVRLDRIERDFKDRLDRMEKRSAFYPPSETVTPPAVPSVLTSSVQIQNLGFLPGTVRVNNAQYIVPAGETVTIPLPAGSVFTYEVVQDARGAYHSPRVRVVPANGPFVVSLNP